MNEPGPAAARVEPRRERETCPACNGAQHFMDSDPYVAKADLCECAYETPPGTMPRPGIPQRLDLRAAYLPDTQDMT